MPVKTRDDVFIEKLTDLLRTQRAGGEPINPIAGGEDEGDPLVTDAARATEPPLNDVAPPSPQPGS